MSRTGQGLALGIAHELTVSCKREGRRLKGQKKRAKVKLVCKVRPVTAGRVKLTRKGRTIASARLKKGSAVVRVRPGRYQVALVRDGRVVKRVPLRVR